MHSQKHLYYTLKIIFAYLLHGSIIDQKLLYKSEE